MLLRKFYDTLTEDKITTPLISVLNIFDLKVEVWFGFFVLIDISTFAGYLRL